MQHESSRDLAEVRSAVPILSGLLSKLASTDASLGLALMALRKRLSDKQDTSTMTDDSLEPQWAQFARALPREPGDQPIATPALVDTIVRIYMAQVRRGALGRSCLLQPAGAVRKSNKCTAPPACLQTHAPIQLS